MFLEKLANKRPALTDVALTDAAYDQAVDGGVGFAISKLAKVEAQFFCEIAQAMNIAVLNQNRY